MKNACFNLLDNSLNHEGITYTRTLNDTSNNKNGITKCEFLNFYTYVPIKGDTIIIVSLEFYEESSYLLYKQEFSQFSKYHSAKKSFVYNFNTLDNKVQGLEYLVSSPLIGGLIEENLDEILAKKYTKKYKVYFYCLINSSGDLRDLTRFFE